MVGRVDVLATNFVFEQHCHQSSDLEVSTHTPTKLVDDFTVKPPTPTQDVIEEFFEYLFAKAARGEMQDPIIISEDDPWPDDAEIREYTGPRRDARSYYHK